MWEPVRGSLLESAADIAGVTVADVGALYHEDVRNPAFRINPRLSAPSPAVTERAGGKHSCYPWVGCTQNAGADAPTVIGAAVPVFGRLEKACGQIAGLDRAKQFEGFGVEILFALERTLSEKHLAETRVIGAVENKPPLPSGG